MGRGAQSATRQLTDQERASIDALNQQLFGQQQQVGNLLLPQFQSILNNPGLSAADKAAVTGQSQGALASAFDALQQSAQNRLARTRNSAGFGELTDELARQKGIAEAGQAQKNQLAFTNTAFQRQMAALQPSIFQELSLEVNEVKEVKEIKEFRGCSTPQGDGE